jgi:hypothetical protein
MVLHGERQPTLTGATPPTSAAVDVAFPGYVFTATGYPAPTFGIAGGSLPAGLALDPATGALSGTPTTPGITTFTVSATNSVGTAVSDPLTLSVTSAPVVPATVTPPRPVQGEPFSYTIPGTGSPAPTYSVTAGTLPPGLVLDAATGTISGTPTATGTYTVTVTVTNSAGSASTTLTFTAVAASPDTPSAPGEEPPAVPDPTSPDLPLGPAESVDGPLGPAELATTGGDTLGTVVLGMTLLLGGALVLFLSRALPGRRQHVSTPGTCGAGPAAGPDGRIPVGDLEGDRPERQTISR